MCTSVCTTPVVHGVCPCVHLLDSWHECWHSWRQRSCLHALHALLCEPSSVHWYCCSFCGGPKGVSASQSMYGCVGRLVRSHPCECYVQKMQCSLQCAHVQGYGNQATGHKHARHVPDLGEVICVFLTHFLLPVFACTVSPPRSWSAVMTAWAMNCVPGSRGW